MCVIQVDVKIWENGRWQSMQAFEENISSRPTSFVAEFDHQSVRSLGFQVLCNFSRTQHDTWYVYNHSTFCERLFVIYFCRLGLSVLICCMAAFFLIFPTHHLYELRKSTEVFDFLCSNNFSIPWPYSFIIKIWLELVSFLTNWIVTKKILFCRFASTKHFQRWFLCSSQKIFSIFKLTSFEQILRKSKTVLKNAYWVQLNETLPLNLLYMKI